MVTLAIESSSGSELTYDIAKATIAIGASSENDVVIRAPGVAPRHLVIQRNDDVFTFLGQHRQVVVLNGERRSRGVLRVGDRIRIGTATLIFKGADDGSSQVELVTNGTAAPEPEPSAPSAPRGRAEVVLYSEPDRLASARGQMVEIFRGGIRANPEPALRAFLETVFAGRQAMLSTLDADGRFQALVSQWTGDVPRLPARTFDELAGSGRYALLRLGSRLMLIYPVGRGALQGAAYLLLETTEEHQDDDEVVLAELARMLTINWHRFEDSSPSLGAWQSSARARLQEELPGTSPAIRLLRDGLLAAARASDPVLLCGRPGSGRSFAAQLLAALHPEGELPVHLVTMSRDEDTALRLELFGSDSDAGHPVPDRMRGRLIVIRDLETLGASRQRELAALIGHDLESGYGPSIRWVGLTGDNVMDLLGDGTLDPALFGLFNRHLMRVPSLADRREDLPLLAVRLLAVVGAEQGKDIRGVELETLNSVLNHPFDGEMTELLTELRRLVSATPEGGMVRGVIQPRGTLADSGAAQVSEAEILASDDLKVVIESVERLVIDRVLRRTFGNQSKAARILNLSRGALIAKIKEYEVPDYRSLRRRR